MIKSIPDFWFNAFLCHPTLRKVMNEEDQKSFNPNPYFEDSKLSKIFTYLPEGTTKDYPIRWKEVKRIPDGIDHEEKGNKRALVDVRFLSWFCDYEQKDDMAYIDCAVADIFANPLAYLKNEEPDVKDADDEVIEVPFFLEKIEEKDEDDDKGVDEEAS